MVGPWTVGVVGLVLLGAEARQYSTCPDIREATCFPTSMPIIHTTTGVTTAECCAGECQCTTLPATFGGSPPRVCGYSVGTA